MPRPFWPKFLCISLALLLALPASALAARQRSPSLSLESVDDAAWQAQAKPSTTLLVKLQVLLDQTYASPGEIDGTLGENTREAITAYAEMKGLEATEQVTEELWRAVTQNDTEPALVTYKVLAMQLIPARAQPKYCEDYCGTPNCLRVWIAGNYRM